MAPEVEAAVVRWPPVLALPLVDGLPWGGGMASAEPFEGLVKEVVGAGPVAGGASKEDCCR